MRRGIGAVLICSSLFSCTQAVKQAVMPRSGDKIQLVQKGSFSFSEEEERFIVKEAKNLNIPIPDREEIKRYISYFLQNKPYLEKTLQRAEYYLPIIKPIVEKSGLPSELSLLPVIESGFNPLAVSRSGAAGLWQFIPSTARRYGLRVDEHVDERFDVIKSTEAAVRYLKDLYSMFGNWELALAGYNCGENCVKYRTAGVDFWITKDMLPEETRNYVPAFFAVLLIMRDPVKYGLFSEGIKTLKKESQSAHAEISKVERSQRERIITLENGAKIIIKE
ncbi:MAG: lytic transglycosylase domain-containing protein [Hydrogenobacter thermophilus]|nr:MAG: lytic transglycosylase domain-containing protein [Hydrogenobacter thermophilus]